jgi:O-antigen/teichoic acid export membrane protein
VYLAMVEAFQGVLFQWHRLALVKFWAVREQGDFRSFLMTSHASGAAMGAAVMIALFGAFALRTSIPFAWVAVILTGLAKSAALYAQELSRAAGAAHRYAFGSLLLTLGGALAGTLAYRLSHSLPGTLIASSVVYVGTALICGWTAATASAGGRFRMADVSEMVRYGLPLIPVFLATTALTRLDRPILAHFESSITVGVYSAASNLVTNVVTAACLLVVTPVYPWLLREKEHRTNESYRRLHVNAGVLMLSGVVAMATGLYFARDIAFPLLLGSRLGVAAESLVLPLLAIAVIGAFRNHFFDQAYHLFSKTHVLMAINVASLGFALVALYCGARMSGLTGMLIGLAIAHGLSLVLSVALARSFVDVRQLVVSVGGLAIVSIIAGAIGAAIVSAGVPVSIAEPWRGLLAATGAIGALAVGMYLSNIGMCRSLLSRSQ